MTKRMFSLVLGVACGVVSDAASLRPAAVDRFHVAPDAPAQLLWTAGGVTAPLDFVIRDIEGRVEKEGQATGSSTIAVEVTLPRGFHEIEFPATGRRFGIAALPPSDPDSDPFFAIDSAMSWLVQDEGVRDGLVKALARCGIGMSRERLRWGEVNPRRGVWSWDEGKRYEALRRSYERSGIAVLEMFHDAPAYLGRVGKYPDDLIASAGCWQRITERWLPTWGALEVWNEPEIFFGADFPADQYVSLIKAVAFGAARGGLTAPLVAGVFAHYRDDYVACAAANGILELGDVISFHTYDRADRMEGLVGRYRSWLKASGQDSKPLWLTECGRPWKRGPDRPPLDQDRASALDITMKAVEARACGVARYFAFVYPFYEENDNNFGMAGRAGTPLACMVAYAQAAAALGGMSYLGDLDCDLKRARVFGGAGGETLVVLYTGEVAPNASVRLPVPVLRAAGIDGRSLALDGTGAVPVPDGLTYAWLDSEGLGDRLLRDTEARRLWRIAAAPSRPRPPAAPVFLRFDFDSAVLTPEPGGYVVADERRSQVPLAVDVFDASGEAREIAVTVHLPEGAKLPGGEKQVSVRVEPAGSAGVAWEADLRGAFARSMWSTVRFTATAGEGASVLPLSVSLKGEPELGAVLEGYPRATKLDVAELPAWRSAIAGGGTMKMVRTEEGAWRLEATFEDGADRWVYPAFTLPAGLDLGRSTGLVVRARCFEPADVRCFLWEGEGHVGYLTPSSVIPADGKWHIAIIPFESLVLSGANDPDPDGRLDRSAVRRLSIGMNARRRSASLEVSDLYVVGP